MKLFFLILLVSTQAWSLDRISLMTSAGHHEQQISAEIARFWTIGSSKFMWGGGLRGTSQWSSDQGYKTAPSLLTTGQEGQHTIFCLIKKKILMI